MFSSVVVCARFLISNPDNVPRRLKDSDLVIGAALIHRSLAPTLVAKKMILATAHGSFVVSVAIGQGGCFETSKPTTHQDPTFLVDDVIHYCVPNIPSEIPRTSTFVLGSVTIPHVLDIANKGITRVIKENRALARGVNVYKGSITHPSLAEATGRDYKKIVDVLA